jgi:hypothetical protein
MTRQSSLTAARSPTRAERRAGLVRNVRRTVASAHGPVFLALAICKGHAAAESVDTAPRIVAHSSPQYEAISFVTEGPAYRHTDGPIRGRFHRLLFINSGLVHDHPIVRLETMTYGDEVCCRRIVAAWELELSGLEGKGVRLPDAATAQLKFIRWRAPRSAELRYGNLSCRLSGIGNPRVSVSCR